MFNANSGYDGYSMSNRAREAYDSGCKPFGKWKKSDILEKLGEEKVKLVEKYSSVTLKSYFLEFDSWHHTSSYFNNTNFYRFVDIEKIDFEYLDKLEESNKKERHEKREARKSSAVRAYCEYGVWSGTRKHPHLEYEMGYCLIKNGWAYFTFGKKDIYSKYFTIIEKYDKAPKGSSEIFNEIAKKYKLSI